MSDLHIEWPPFSMYCPNCGELMTGYQNSEGLIRKECDICHMLSVRKNMGRRHTRIDLYPPREHVAVPTESEELPFL